MQMKALDTIRISSAEPKGRQEPGDVFEINDHEGKELAKRGLAVEVKSKASPKNKSRGTPQNNKGK